MPNPKRKHTRSRRDSRRSQNWKLAVPSLSPCPHQACGKLRRSHTICPHCGFYNGKIVIAPKQKKEKGGGESSSESKK
jgi:large subunit ribosomal protein L32